MAKLARDLMTRDLACCSPNATLDEVVATMARHQIRRVPVVDDGGCCAGIIAQADLASEAPPHEAAALVREVSRPRG